MRRKTGNYLNNRDLMTEIHNSKSSYCKFSDPSYKDYDYIVTQVPEDALIDADYSKLPITQEDIEVAREKRAIRLQKRNYQAALNSFYKGPKPKEADFKIDPTTISYEEIVFRVLTYEHIPQEIERKKTHRTYADMHPKLNFIPFKHYIIGNDSDHTIAYIVDGKEFFFKEVGKSHYNSKDEFSVTHGSVTTKLATMYMLLVERYAEKTNWRGYSYVDEMQGAALVQLSYAGLQFNEMKSDNPFSYLTSFVSNSFTRVLNLEKQNQNLRDDLLTSAGHDPSWTRQFEYEESIRKGREEQNYE